MGTPQILKFERKTLNDRMTPQGIPNIRLRSMHGPQSTWNQSYYDPCAWTPKRVFTYKTKMTLDREVEGEGFSEWSLFNMHFKRFANVYSKMYVKK